MEQNIEDADNFDNLLTLLYDPDIEMDENRRQDTDEYNLSYFVNKIPTTNTGELAHCIEEETRCGGTFGNIKISGRILLNQCGTMFTRKKYHIKGRSRHKLSLQKIIATCHGSSIPLIYPGGFFHIFKQ